MRSATPVEVSEDTSPIGGTVERHPAFGMIGISHVHSSGGGMRLFGSSLHGHPGLVQITVRRGHRRHTVARDWFHGDDPIVEVYLSHAQFAELITTPNQGSGVPCTLSYTETDGPIPEFLPTETEAEKIRAHVEDKAREIVANLRASRERIEQALANAPAKARKAALDEIDKLIRDVGSNMPFYVESLRESMEKTVSDAKTEVEAFVNSAVRSAGLQAIAEQGASALRLSGPIDSDDEG